jgi:mannitol-1-phosphate/altronate dehydrogenase
MTTSPQLTAAEIAAGTTALKAMVATLIQAWEQRMVPAAYIDQAVAAVVAAVDKVRDATPQGDSNV